jgi:hypothetical protein
MSSGGASLLKVKTKLKNGEVSIKTPDKVLPVTVLASGA